MNDLTLAQERILAWAKQNSHVRALFWYGSYSIKKEKADSDLDVAVLFEPHSTPNWQELEQMIGDVRLKLGVTSGSGRVTFFIGDGLRRVDLSWATTQAGLAWLADCPEVPEPRLVLAFERDGAGRELELRAAVRLEIEPVWRAHEEIEKFTEAFEAASRAHSRSDAYAFYFHYNLALHRLARLVAISRNGLPRLYLVPQLTNTLLAEAERSPFIALSAPMDLKQGNQAKLRLQEQFIKFVRELGSGPLKLDVDVDSLTRFLDAVRIRDAMYNVRDVGVWLGSPLTKGRLFRASVLSRWQDEPFLGQWLRANRIGRIIDFREDKETEGPAYKPETLIGIDYRRFPLKQGGKVGPDKPQKERNYIHWLDRHPQAFVAALRSLEPGSPPIAAHCKAGMDRTGIFVALAGLLLGVGEDKILADYEASGVTVSRKWMEQFCDEIRSRGGAQTVLAAYGWTDDDTARLRNFFNSPEQQ
jgi:protein-tyrosine phosphatase